MVIADIQGGMGEEEVQSVEERVPVDEEELARFDAIASGAQIRPRGLKGIARELDVPVNALAQLSRKPDDRSDHRPMLSDLRDSGAIEQDADIVMFIYRDEVYDPDTKDKGIAELLIAKNRAGEIGKVRLSWIAELTKFANLEYNQDDYRE